MVHSLQVFPASRYLDIRVVNLTGNSGENLAIESMSQQHATLNIVFDITVFSMFHFVSRVKSFWDIPYDVASRTSRFNKWHEAFKKGHSLNNMIPCSSLQFVVFHVPAPHAISTMKTKA